MKSTETPTTIRPCENCGVDVREDEYCGIDKSTENNAHSAVYTLINRRNWNLVAPNVESWVWQGTEYLCPDCYCDREEQVRAFVEAQSKP